jgi:hypothetical protein
MFDLLQPCPCCDKPDSVHAEGPVPFCPECMKAYKDSEDSYADDEAAGYFW